MSHQRNDEPTPPEPEMGQLIARGHGAGEIVEAWKWKVLEQDVGLLVVEAHLPPSLRNPQGQLFGGFTPTYVDLVSIFTVRTADPDRDPTSPGGWVTTINIRVDYFEPIIEPQFTIRGELVNRRGHNSLVATKFFQHDKMAAHALTTLRQVPVTESEL